MNYKKAKKLFIFNMLCLLCTSCAPAWLEYDHTATDLQINRSSINTKRFTIAIYSNESFGRIHTRPIIHVYFDGDGSPWRNTLSINDDPTPRQYLVLRLMSMDSTPSILIGRPCYHGFSHEPNCHPLLWTNQRYSEEVVSTMIEALNIILKKTGEPEIALIGYSGGGALAQLLAERIQKTRAVVTLAGNLDTNAWIKLHKYSPLDGSLNPAERLPLPPQILQINYVGRSDSNIPKHLIESYVSKKNQGEIVILDYVDHYNGWLNFWPGILKDLNKRLAPAKN